MESPETGRIAGIVMEFPTSESESFTCPPRLPRRLRRRLIEGENNGKTPCTVEEIEAKLKLADLRRQKFYENLSNKARVKLRSPLHSLSLDNDLSQRLEAKLHAAEVKRSSIIEKARMRLARLDELRQATKSGRQMRFEMEREELGTKVESRIQQAEENRMRILKANRQRRALLEERSSQSLLRRMSQERKYKECVLAAIHQKRASAEKKRLGLLEAEKKKACAMVLQVQQVAKSVSLQHELERRRMRDQLEDRLQRAKRQRAQYLRQKRKQPNSVRLSCIELDKQADLLSRKLARCWRQFLMLRRTTLALAQAFDALNINVKCVKSMPFEQLAVLIESTTTRHTLKALLDRFESRVKIFTSVATPHVSSSDNLDPILKQAATPKKMSTPGTSTRSRGMKKVGSLRERTGSPTDLSRYPVRIVLCAYMILGHPDAVFNVKGDHEIALAKSSEDFICDFELLIKIILEVSVESHDEDSDSMLSSHRTFRSQLISFDRAWCSFLNYFMAWKAKDARSLEEDLIRAACQLELSMIKTCKQTREGNDDCSLSCDTMAIKKQVMEDQKILRGKVRHLSGDPGIQRLEVALSETRYKHFQEKETGRPLGSPISLLSPSPPSSSASPFVVSLDRRRDSAKAIEKSSAITDDHVILGESSTSASRSLGGQLGSSCNNSVSENELIVNGFLHEQGDAFSGDSVKEKIRETMEKAFWDATIESVNQDEPCYDRVVQLMKEVRDEICNMAPQSWKEEIFEVIDLDILSQVLNSGTPDIHHLGKVLEFALLRVQKLSSPANEDVMKASHQKFLEDLAKTCQQREDPNHLHVLTIIKGLRFVLEQIQALKQEISKSRIRIMEPLLKGSAGLDYLRTAFSKRYGSPSDAFTTLPLTVGWLSSVRNCKDQEWEEHTHSISTLACNESSPLGLSPSVILRTGGSFLVKTNESQAAASTGNQQIECKGENVDLSVRLGLLKLVIEVSGLTQEALPETFMLNLSRLRTVQAQIQKIIVICTSILICRQFIVSEQIVASPAELESMTLKCTEQLSELLEQVQDAGLEEIVEIISKNGDTVADMQNIQSREVVIARMLTKSLQAGDPVFLKVSQAVYLAARGVVLGGSGPSGMKLAEAALRQVGAAALTNMVVEVCKVLVLAATVSVGVHGPWYKHIADNI